MQSNHKYQQRHSMKIFKEIEPLRHFLKQKKALGQSLGLVPTMGALHQGHASLLEASLSENTLTVCSIFVNPIQFNNTSDLEKYPRTLEQDISLLEKMGCDLLFCPTEKEMYLQDIKLTFQFGKLEQVMEGAFRSGHFSGVGVVVAKFFNIVQPDRAYFGQKDLQQFTIIDFMVRALNIDVDLVCLPIVREESGLARSSRNKRLSVPQREKATVLYKALKSAKNMLLEGTSVTKVKQFISIMVGNVEEVELEYFEIVNREDLSSLEEVHRPEDTALCIAGFVGEVRLIDNMFLI